VTELADKDHRPATAEEVLALHGLDGAWLMRTAGGIARVYCQRTGASLGDRFDDLLSVLCEAGCKAALSFDPTKAGPGYSFRSYVGDKMELAIEPDFFRRKREGFGDRRYQHDGRVELSADAGEDVDPEVNFEKLLSERRLARWHRAAELYELSLAEFIAVAVDRVAREAIRKAA
jgi:hypothetical protein